jgi:urease accessory protein
MTQKDAATMNFSRIPAWTAALFVLMVTSSAWAHISGVHDGALLSAIAHPLAGLDHVLAALALGLWVGQLKTLDWWVLPSVFLGCLVAGMTVGQLAGYGPVVEFGIIGSLIVFGTMVLREQSTSRFIALTLTTLFALLHGLAHAPIVASLEIGTGIALGTALVIGAGIAIGRLKQQTLMSRAVKAAGGIIVMAGIAFLVVF